MFIGASTISYVSSARAFCAWLPSNCNEMDMRSDSSGNLFSFKTDCNHIRFRESVAVLYLSSSMLLISNNMRKRVW